MRFLDGMLIPLRRDSFSHHFGTDGRINGFPVTTPGTRFGAPSLKERQMGKLKTDENSFHDIARQREHTHFVS